MREMCLKTACLLTTMLIVTSMSRVANADTARYLSEIKKRNVFGLRAPEVKNDPAPPPALPKLVLSGITTILGDKRVLLKEQPIGPDGRTPDPRREISMILAEGEREGHLEVLQIDEKVGAVKVNNSGTVMTLTFEKDGVKPPASVLPASPPGATPTARFPGNLHAAVAVRPGQLPASTLIPPPPAGFREQPGAMVQP